MQYSVNLSLTAIEDIQLAVDYYNSQSAKLGLKFSDEVDNSMEAIARMPTAYSYRYKNVRAKLLYKFPFLIFFIIDEDKCTVEVLRIFNAHQDPHLIII